MATRTGKPDAPPVGRPAVVAALAARGFTQRGNEWSGRCPHPDHDDQNPSFGYNHQKDTFNCFGCEWRGNGAELAVALGVDGGGDAASASAAPRHREFVYIGPDGVPVRRKLRIGDGDGKQIWWEHTTGHAALGKATWIKGKGDAPPLIFNLPAVRAAAGTDATVLFCEGEPHAELASTNGFVGTTAGGANDWRADLAEQLAGCHVVLLPDWDEPGYQHMAAVARAILPHAASVRWLDLPGLGPKEDLVDWLPAHSAKALRAEVKRALPIRSAADIPPNPHAAPLTPARDLGALLALDLPPPESIIVPYLNRGEILLLVGWRGSGKTHFCQALGIHAAADHATSFLNSAIKGGPWTVLHVNSELPDALMQRRAALHQRALPRGASVGAGRWHYLSRQSNPDLFVGDLTTPAMQAGLEHHIAATGAQLLILDSLATLLPGGDNEREAREWPKVQSWLLAVRDRFNLSVVLVHQEGKTPNRGARGTSKYEDIPDTVMVLETGRDDATAGAQFTVRFTKARNFWGRDAAPFGARLVAELDETPRWERVDVVRVTPKKSQVLAGALRAHIATGMSAKNAADLCGVSEGYASKVLKLHPMPVASDGAATPAAPGPRRRKF